MNPSIFRHHRDVTRLEEFFADNFKYIGILKDKLTSDNYMKIYKEIKYESYH